MVWVTEVTELLELFDVLLVTLLLLSVTLKKPSRQAAMS